MSFGCYLLIKYQVPDLLAVHMIISQKLGTGMMWQQADDLFVVVFVCAGTYVQHPGQHSMRVYAVYVGQFGDPVPDNIVWELLPVDTSSMVALKSSLCASAVSVFEEEPVPCWNLVDAASLALVVEDCKLKVVRAGEDSPALLWTHMNGTFCLPCTQDHQSRTSSYTKPCPKDASKHGPCLWVLALPPI